MGRHASVEGAGPHPLVADALERRTVPAPRGTHRGEPTVTAPQASSSVGWPAAPGRGEGLGWPADPQPATGAGDDGSLLAVLDAALDTPVEVPVPRRSGWRRLFGGGQSSTTSAA